ncbi:MAG: septation protein SpoVG family protein [Candidatus Omnitrophica bacterium]|nr:septation protein SpoVG family protein [Candidatus Omnitrophota bacterium]
MEITEVRIFLKESDDKKLKAFATVTFDNSFVVRNVKIIEGTKGLFVAMPSRKMKESCPKCGFKNAIRSRFCNQCGAAIEPHILPPVKIESNDKTTRQSEHRDIAHPITSEFRDYIQKKVVEAYENEKSGGPAAGKRPYGSGAHEETIDEDIE